MDLQLEVFFVSFFVYSTSIIGNTGKFPLGIAVPRLCVNVIYIDSLQLPAASLDPSSTTDGVCRCLKFVANANACMLSVLIQD